jgi:hypothetical protein
MLNPFIQLKAIIFSFLKGRGNGWMEYFYIVILI